jgi:predicted MFS family arabinose efflux permease
MDGQTDTTQTTLLAQLSAELKIFPAKGLKYLFISGQSTIYTYLVDYAHFCDVNKHNAAFLLSIIGITNTVARIAIGWITDHPQIDSTLIYASALLVSGIIAFVIPFCETFLPLAICSGLFGICMGEYSHTVLRAHTLSYIASLCF